MSKPFILSVSAINPDGSILTQNIFNLLNEIFKVSESIYLEENETTYTTYQIEELADAIVSIKESEATQNK